MENMEIKITDSPPLFVSRSKILEEFTKELKYRGIDDKLACLWLDPIYTGRSRMKVLQRKVDRGTMRLIGVN